MALLNSLFVGKTDKRYYWVVWTGIAGLYLIGLLGWAWFLGWGKTQFDFHDWGEITIPRLAFLQNAVKSGQLPLHMLSLRPLGGATDRFLSVPDQILSPEIFLLGVLTIPQFILADMALMYTLGFIGLLWVRRKFNLSFFSLALLFTLFNFNGHILAHITAGHASWGGYFLFPWFFLLMIDLVENKAGWVWISKVSFLLFFILLQGSYHQFVWLLYFLGFLILALPRHTWTILKAGLFSILVSLCRLLPPILVLSRFRNNYFGGYPNLVSIWNSLVYSDIPGIHKNWNGLTNSTGTWEFTLYTGLLAALVLVYFGLIRVLQSPGTEKVLLVPVFGIAILSFDDVFRLVRTIFAFPPFSGERIASRAISLSFVIVLILAVIYFQRWLDERKPSRTGLLLMLGLFLININDLWKNFFRWEVSKQVKTFDPFFIFNAEEWLVANHHDTKYLLMLGLGLLVTATSSIYLVWKMKKETVQASKKNRQTGWQEQ